MPSLRTHVLSKLPVIMLSTVTAGATYAIYYAHRQQVIDKETMRNGVIRDIKRDRKKRLEQQQLKEQQH